MTRPRQSHWWNHFPGRDARRKAPPLRLERLEPRDLPANTLSIGDAVLTEGNSGSANMVFTLTRTGDMSADWTVGYQTVAGTAVAGSDFTAQSGTATILAGSPTATINVPILGDTLDEKNETFSVVLNGPVTVGGVPMFFNSPQAFATPAVPVFTATADLNGDGKPDIITANRDNDNISVFLNTTAPGATTVTFGTRQDITTASQPHDIVATDLNGDGKPDLAVVNKYSNNVTVMINRTDAGETTFLFGPRTYFGLTVYPQSLAVGDVNGDGKPDLLSASTTGGIFKILLNGTDNGAITPVFTDGGLPYGSGAAVAMLDVNGDGKADLVGVSSDSVAVRLNKTPGGSSTLEFELPQYISTSPATSAVTVADVNGDGKPDFITTSYNLNVASVLLNTTAPGAKPVTVGDRWDFTTGGKPVGVRMALVDGDTRPDLVVTSYGTVDPDLGKMSVFRNTTVVGAAIPTFGPRVDTLSNAGPRSPVVADINQDGQPDVAVVDRFGPDTMSVFLQNSVQITKAAGVGTIIDDDTYLAVAADAGGGPHVRVINPVTGVDRFSFFAYGAAFTGGVRVAVGDVTGDGVADIITAAGPGGGPHVKVFSGVDGSLAASFFAYGASFTGGVFLAVGNFDADPQLEIVTAAGAGGGPHVRVFNVAGGGATPLAGPLGGFFAYGASFSGGVAVAAGNVDGVGFDEVITSAGPGGGPHVKAFRTDGSLAASFFAYDGSFSGGVYVAAGDVDENGSVEIIAGPGAGGGQAVKAFKADGSVVASFTAYSNFNGAVRVAFETVGGLSEIVTSPGSGLGPDVRRFRSTTQVLLGEFMVFDPGFMGGVFVGGN